MIPIGRREVLALACTLLPLRPALGGPFEDAIAARIGDPGAIGEGGITLRVPAFAESGWAVPVAIEVDDAAATDDPAVAIHLFAPANRLVHAASFTLDPALGAARLRTRIRLAESQEVVAIAVLAGGRRIGARARIDVAVGSACAPAPS